ncbi:MAG: HEPN domain-containing protein [Bacteroidales bacterium]
MAEFVKHYEVLHTKAKVDLKAAKNLYADFKSGEEDLDLDVVLFHLHQCAEKIIKSLLSYHDIDYPKVHDLELLYNLLQGNKIKSDLDLDLLIELSDYAVEGRYAFIKEDVKDIGDYMNMLEKVINNPF